MILTVTLNPLLEKIYTADKVQINHIHRCTNTFFRAGGKGINVSRQLNLLGIKNSALTFLGGANGKRLRKLMTGEGIDFTAVSTKAETRAGAVFTDADFSSVTTMMENGFGISESEADEFINRYDKAVRNCTAVLLMGSSPSAAAEKIFPAAVEIAKKYGKFTAVDTYGGNLSEIIDKAPDVVHNNSDELKKSLGVTLNNEKEIIDFLHFLNSKGVNIAFVTNGGKAGYAMQFGFTYKFIPPEIKELDSQGSGDAFMAGYFYGFDKSLIFKDSLAFASALGAANAGSFEVCSVKPEDAEKLLPEVSIETVGKKLKIIDDSPTA